VTVTRRPSVRAALVLSVAKVLALGAVLVVLVSGFAVPTPTSSHESALRLDSGPKDLQRAMTEHDCTVTGFGESATPRSALIRRQGRLEHVSFEAAWSVFTGERPGELLAVCLSKA
jgi:hypothetical protein